MVDKVSENHALDSSQPAGDHRATRKFSTTVEGRRVTKKTGDASTPTGHIVVVGSINMDLVARMARLPRPGETVESHDLSQIPGGKGANQAAASARLGARTSMVGRVGDDSFGPTLTEALQRCGVDVGTVLTTGSCPSGIALIGVEDSGENAITIVAGANAHLTPNDVGSAEEVIAQSDAMLLQLEIPLETVEAALEMARRHGVLTVLDPAPAPMNGLPDTLFQVDVITPNQSEAEALTDLRINRPQDASRAAKALRARGPRDVVLTLGADGAFLSDHSGQETLVTAPHVNAVDTTAAGDAFSAALAVGLTEGSDPLEAVRFACAAGALATTKLGAQPAMPSRSEVDNLLLA